MFLPVHACVPLCVSLLCLFSLMCVPLSVQACQACCAYNVHYARIFGSYTRDHSNRLSGKPEVHKVSFIHLFISLKPKGRQELVK